MIQDCRAERVSAGKPARSLLRALVHQVRRALADPSPSRSKTPGTWACSVAADEVYGRCPALRGAIEHTSYRYVLEVGSDFRVSHHPGDTCRADALQ